MFCSHCGAQLVEGAKFCAKCGAAVQGPGVAAPAAEPAAAPEPAVAAEPAPAVASAPSPVPVQGNAAQQPPAPAGGLSRPALIAIVAAIVVVVAIVAGAIGCNAGRVSVADPSQSSSSDASVASSEPGESAGSASADAPDGSSAAGSASASSASASGSASASSASAPSAAMMPSPSGELVEYKSGNGGFGITIDEAFAVKDTADQFIVYTAKEGVLPQYQVIWSRTPNSGMTDAEVLENMIDIAVENHGDRILVGPVPNSFQLTDGRTVQGIEYIYEANNGGQLAKYEYYEDQANGFTYTWVGICDPDDNVTPKAMELAMDSFHFLVS